MSYVHPAWLEHQRRRFERHDAHRFVKPEIGQRKSYAERMIDERHAKEHAAFEAEQESLQRDLAQLRWLVADLKLDLAIRKLRLKYRPDQPRDERGRWVDDERTEDIADQGGSENFVISDAEPDNNWILGEQYAANETSKPAGIGHNNGPPLEEPPEVPQTRPKTTREKNDFIKSAARWITNAVRIGRSVSPFVAAYEALSWLDTDRPLIESYQDAPKTFEELQQAVSKTSTHGYNDHHIAEQAAARDAGYSKEMIEGSDNKVRIPTLKHWELTGWYQRRNRRFVNPQTGEEMSPRDYLEDKDWTERRRVGLEALIEFKVLRP